MYKTVEVYSEPRTILDIMEEPCAEMSSFDHDFLCGLIKEFRPKKLVEIGVAGGGTTAVIQNCIELLDLNTQFISVDLSKEHYRKKGEKTGYLYEKVSDYFKKENHTFYIGKLYADVAEEIGDGIDFLVLDTVHFMPGEFLDFLYALPYLTKNAVVVFHDIMLGLINCSDAICNKLLFDSITGEKYWDIIQIEQGILPNIAAVQINDSTRKTMENVFTALSINWFYIPELEVIQKYRQFYEKQYNQECLTLFDAIVVNQLMRQNRKSVDINDYLSKFNEEMKDSSIYIYGAGRHGMALKSYLETNDINYKGFVVSDDVDISKYRSDVTNTYHLSDIRPDYGKIVVAVAECNTIILTLCKEKYDFCLIPETIWSMWGV